MVFLANPAMTVKAAPLIKFVTLLMNASGKPFQMGPNATTEITVALGIPVKKVYAKEKTIFVMTQTNAQKTHAPDSEF